MARTGDPRKRSRPAGAAATPARRTRPQPPPEPASPASGGWVPRDETLVFPSEPAPVPPSRIALPPSGLAADILASLDTAGVPATEPAPEAGERPEESAPVRAHNISFFATPAREERKAAEPTEHLATFLLDREEYGVDVRLVQEIIRVGEITAVPRSPASIKGVINLRGRIVPVMDLKSKLGLGAVAPSRLSRIVVVKVKERLIGLLVDGASQVLKVPVSTIEPAPEEVVEIDVDYIRGVAKLKDRLIILVDLLKILAPELREGGAEGSG